MDVDIRYTRSGRGEPLLLVHGIGHRRQAWDPVLGLLTAHHDVIAVDLPGFGESPGLPDGMAYDLPTTVANFRDFYEHLGIDPPHVVGNSLGGALALELGAAGLARTVTALSPAGFWSAGERHYALALLTSLRMTTFVPDVVVRRIAATPRLRREALRPVYAHPERVDAELFLAEARAMRTAVGFAPTAATGRAYSCRAVPDVPVTIAWGDRDRVLLPRQADIARRRLPGAVHVSLPGCGHVPMGDDPELVAELILLGTGRQAAAA